MHDKPVPEEPEHIDCAVCLKDIPKSVATSMEGPDYVQHFCGLECYEQWQEEQTESKDKA